MFEARLVLHASVRVLQGREGASGAKGGVRGQSKKMNKESKLESLRLLFSPGFDDNDLLSILEEAQDDLDLAIARISEGQTATWELRKPKIKNTHRGRGRGSFKTISNRQKEFTPKESNRVAQEKTNVKAGLIGAVEPKNFNQKKKKSLDKKDKTSWAQLVKG
jgi:hypothetical protein